MRQVWPESFVPVHSAAPEFGRYTVFGHHFARAGNEVFRLDRHPVMAVHPVTPMKESDLRRVLADQGFAVQQLVDWRLLEQHSTNSDAIALALKDGDSAVFDGCSQQHAVTTAAALWQLSRQRQVCALAAQGLAHGLGQFMREHQLVQADVPVQQLAATDRLLVLSGSCSALSAAQIQAASQHGFVCLRLGNAVLLGQDDPAFAQLMQRTRDALQNARSVVVYTAEGPDDAQSDQLRAQTANWPAGELAKRIGERFAQLADMAFKQTGLTRLVVAGGDSSSFTMRALGAQALQVKASHFGQNAHFCSLVSNDPGIHGQEVLLKGGQVGNEHLYAMALAGFGPH